MADTRLFENSVVQTDVNFRHEVRYRFTLHNFNSIEQRDFKTTCPVLPTEWTLTVKFQKAIQNEAVACTINIKRVDSRQGLVRGYFGMDFFFFSGANPWRVCGPIYFKISEMANGQEMTKTLSPVLTRGRMSSFSDGKLIYETNLRINGCCSWIKSESCAFETAWKDSVRLQNAINFEKPVEPRKFLVNSGESILSRVASGVEQLMNLLQGVKFNFRSHEIAYLPENSCVALEDKTNPEIVYLPDKKSLAALEEPRELGDAYKNKTLKIKPKL